MRACMLQPRGGSDARADFAEQVAVWISDCPLVVGGIAPGPSAGRRPARVRSRAPKRRLRREGRVRFCGYCTLGHKQFMCFVALKLDSIGWFLIGNSVYICIYPDKIAPGPDWFIKVPTQRAQILKVLEYRTWYLWLFCIFTESRFISSSPDSQIKLSTH
jgi:hypothetical protein